MKNQWPRLKNKAKAKWPKLSDQDLGTLDGSSEALSAKVAERYGCSTDDAKRQVDQFCKENDETGQAARPTAGSTSQQPGTQQTRTQPSGTQQAGARPGDRQSASQAGQSGTAGKQSPQSERPTPTTRTTEE